MNSSATARSSLTLPVVPLSTPVLCLLLLIPRTRRVTVRLGPTPSSRTSASTVSVCRSHTANCVSVLLLSCRKASSALTAPTNSKQCSKSGSRTRTLQRLPTVSTSRWWLLWRNAVATLARLSSLRKTISLNAASGSSAVTVLPMISVTVDSTTSSLPAKMSTSSCLIPRCTPTPVVRLPRLRRSALSPSSLRWVSVYARKTSV